MRLLPRFKDIGSMAYPGGSSIIQACNAGVDHNIAGAELFMARLSPGTLSMHDRVKSVGQPSSFGWHWIRRMLLLRRGQVTSILAMTGAVCAAVLVFPISTQKAVEAIVAGRADWVLAGLALTAIAAVALEAA